MTVFLVSAVFTVMLLLSGGSYADDVPDLGVLEQDFIAQSVGEEKHVIRNDAEWQAFWTRFSATPAPVVDFADKDLLVYLMGVKGSGGYSAKIGPYLVESARNAIQVIVHRCVPDKDGAQIAVLEAPFDAVFVRKIPGALLDWKIDESVGSAACMKEGQ